MTRLKRWADDVWTATGPKPLLGVDLLRRMVLVRLPDGTLWVHSPIDLDPELKAEVDALGTLRHVVAPNKVHHLGVPSWVAGYPDARVYGAPGLAERIRSLSVDEVLAHPSPAAWGDVFDQRVITAAPLLNEVIFLHRPSRTVIVTDLVTHFTDLGNGLGAWLLASMGLSDKVSSAFTWLAMRNRAELRAQVGEIVAWDFDRAVLSHGECLNTDAKAALAQAFGWLRPLEVSRPRPTPLPEGR